MSLALALSADARPLCEEILLPIPLHAQKLGFTCGSSCTRSLLHHFTGWDLGEEWLATQLGTYWLGYTPPDHITRLFHHYGFFSDHLSGFTFSDLRTALVNHQGLIVSVTLDGEAHYAVVAGISATHVRLMDPWIAHSGIYSLKTIEEFLRMWTVTIGGQTYRHHTIRVSRTPLF